MTLFVFANNVNTQLAGSISSSATSLTLSSAFGLPASIPSGYCIAITLNDSATQQNFEIVYATAISGSTLSGLLRGQEGTHALAWNVGDFAFSAPTAGQMKNATQLPQFASLLAGSGWKKYPDPNSPTGFFIEQWGETGVAGNGAITTVTLPIPFPTVTLSTVASYLAGTIPTGSGSLGAAPNTLSTIHIQSTHGGAGSEWGVFYRALGY